MKGSAVHYVVSFLQHEKSTDSFVDVLGDINTYTVSKATDP